MGAVLGDSFENFTFQPAACSAPAVDVEVSFYQLRI
jgi:hypothetical protein